MNNKADPYKLLTILAAIIFLIPKPGISQSSYDEFIDYYKNYNFKERMVPVIPPKDQQLNVIIDADAKNEIDDQWALTLAFLSPERFNIIGLVGATFAWGGPQSIEKSVKEIDTLLKLTDLVGKIPVFKGAHPLRYKYEPSESEGVVTVVHTLMCLLQGDK